MIVTYFVLVVMAVCAFIGWPIALFFALSNRRRLARIEQILKSNDHA